MSANGVGYIATLAYWMQNCEDRTDRMYKNIRSLGLLVTTGFSAVTITSNNSFYCLLLLFCIAIIMGLEPVTE